MSKYVTTQQYEPLRTPQGWSGDERRLIAQLTDIFDDIYRRFGRLRMEDLSSKTQAVINAKAESGDVEKLEAELTLTAEGLSSKVSKGEVISAINQSAEEVAIEASKINLNGAVTANKYFKINTDGSMEAVSGKIGGFTIGENTLTGQGKNTIILDSQTGDLQIGKLKILAGLTPWLVSTEEIEPGVYNTVGIVHGLRVYQEQDSETMVADIDSYSAWFSAPVYSEGVRVPKIVSGSCYVSGDDSTIINYSGGEFTDIPVVVATYSQTSSNISGDAGVVKIYGKSLTSAYVILSGSGTRQIDWIAVGV